MITKEYAMAYKEVVEILKYVPEEDVAKISKEKLGFYRENMDKEYDYKIDETKEFEEQEMLDITKAILANIFRDYWATPYQRERILAKEKYDLEKLEEGKREKYNPDNIFKKKDTNESIPSNNELHENTTLPIEVKKEKFYEKMINFFKNLFHIN